ncbi:MAG: inositol monophosphatase family protein, partial [Candidatus Acidiferrales bacterium]
PKHEWDVAAGAALVLASGGVVKTLEGAPPVFNRPNPWLDGLLAYSAGSQKQLESFLAERRKRGEEGAR